MRGKEYYRGPAVWGPDYVAYVFVCPGSVIVCRFTNSYQTQVTQQLTVSRSVFAGVPDKIFFHHDSNQLSKALTTNATWRKWHVQSKIWFCQLNSTRQAYFSRYKYYSGVRGGAVGWGTALQVGRSWVRFPMVSLEFFIDIILPAALWPWGRLSL
jgi:hypothetical protein